ASAVRRPRPRQPHLRMPPQGRLAGHASARARSPARGSYRLGSSAVALSAPPSSARLRSMRLPGLRLHRRQRPRRPILRLPDSKPQRSLLSHLRPLRFAAEPSGTRYAQLRPKLSSAPCQPGPRSRSPESSSRSSSLFFVRPKDLACHAEDSAEFSDAATIEQLFALYAARYPELAKYRSSVVASRNQEFAAWDTPLRSGDEVAFLPPVSGG